MCMCVRIHLHVCVCMHVPNACDRLDNTLQDAEKQMMFHALEEMDQDTIAGLVLAI